LDRGAEVNVRDNGEYTALSLAKAHKKSDVVYILQKTGGIEGKDIKDETVKTFKIK
jgi:ankyrin repeat protein